MRNAANGRSRGAADPLSRRDVGRGAARATGEGQPGERSTWYRAALRPRARELMGDRERRRKGELLRRSGERRSDLRAFEPARVLELGAVDGDRLAHALREAAAHQRRGERPRLRGVVGDATDVDPGLFLDLAPGSLFE